MKIVSWNVNGLRSAEEQFLKFIESEQPDLLLLQEVRAHPDQLSFFLKFVSHYKVEFNHSGRPGYGGTAVYYNESLSLDKLTDSVGDKILDSEGRSMLCELNGLSFFNFYVPNGNSGAERLNYKLSFYEAMRDYFKKQLEHNKPVIIGGDFNVAHTELDLFAPETSKNSGFLPEERKWFSDLLGIGLIDTFRMFERGGGHYTWWHLKDPKREKNQGWRYDYFLVSENLREKVKRSEILKNVFGSDHCPILLEIEL
ncbi:exodeoxyribonuclease III [Candidatus Shapirobacteria bacterium]|nr:exodeoxyribonuclease III [Candidatus Shapirobacteria bacterium]